MVGQATSCTGPEAGDQTPAGAQGSAAGASRPSSWRHASPVASGEATDRPAWVAASTTGRASAGSAGHARSAAQPRSPFLAGEWPFPVTRARQILAHALELGAYRVSVEGAGGRTLVQIAHPAMAAGEAAGDLDTLAAAVVVDDVPMAIVRLVGPAHAHVTLEHAVQTAALRLADAWIAAQEIDSLAGELVHTYEELHLLYGLGEALTGQLNVASVADRILEQAMDTLRASWAELRLIDATPPVYRRAVAPPQEGAGEGSAACLTTMLRSGGQVVGTIVLGRARSDAPFTSADAKLLDAVGTLTGHTLRTIQLHEAVRRQAEAALRLRESEASALREVDRLKNEFLQTISHELRTPLTVIQGYADLLRTRARRAVASLGPSSVAQPAEHIVTASAQLARLVDDLLDFARIERGEVLLRPTDFDLVPTLQDLLQGFRQQSRGSRLVWKLPPSLPVHADRVRMTQVVYNLITNAMKYAPEGRILLRAKPLDGPSGGVYVEVEDQGPGIAPEEQSRVWEKLFRGSRVAGLNLARGSGIGLAVVRALVEAHGGRVGLTSTPGQGSRFWFEIPAPAAQDGSSFPAASATQDSPSSPTDHAA